MNVAVPFKFKSPFLDSHIISQALMWLILLYLVHRPYFRLEHSLLVDILVPLHHELYQAEIFLIFKQLDCCMFGHFAVNYVHIHR